MSNPGDNPSDPGPRSQTLTILAILGCMGIFVLILWVAYLPLRTDDPLATTAQERMEILQEVRSLAAARRDTLEVIDLEEGVFKIPLEHAMELTVRKYQRRGQAPAEEQP